MSKQRESSSDANISPIYPVNRPNLAATLRFEWSREKLKRFKEAKEMLMRDKFKKPSWGVKNSHAFYQMTLEYKLKFLFLFKLLFFLIQPCFLGRQMTMK